METTDLLNETQQRRLLANARHADQLLGEIEQILVASQSKAAFPKYQPDVTPYQARLIRSHIARFRDHLRRVLAAMGVRHGGAQFGSLHSIRVTLTFVRIAVEEMGPEFLRGSGHLRDEAVVELRGLSTELEGLLNTLERQLALGEGADLQARIEHLGGSGSEADVLRLLDRLVGEHELAEFRSPLYNVVEKLEAEHFEIAVFGRVSSGKSSLLNHLLETDLMPVGVNPITAVPTRVQFSREPHLKVTFADRRVTQLPTSELAQYASEEQNPGNQREVVRLIVGLDSPRLREGLVFVDTPGLGALATKGADETLAYLPLCDLGIVLISSVNPINDEDLGTIHALSQARIPVMILLSKADLLSPEDREKALAYAREQVVSNLGITAAVHPVSTIAGHEQLLEDWFHNELEPLCGRHRELARESVRRKIAALVSAVIVALRSKLGANAPPADVDTAGLEEIERQLRDSAGILEQTRRSCLAATNEAQSRGSAAVENAADAVVASWNGRDASRQDGADPARHAIHAVAAEAASLVSGPLRAAARELDSALRLAGDSLGGAARDGSLESCLREMPRFEAALPAIDVRPPWFRTLRGVTKAWVGRELRRKGQREIDAAFVNYGRVLDAWTQRALAEMQGKFDSRADAYRAQLGRLITSQSVPAEERARIEHDVATLENLLDGSR